MFVGISANGGLTLPPTGASVGWFWAGAVRRSPPKSRRQNRELGLPTPSLFVRPFFTFYFLFILLLLLLLQNDHHHYFVIIIIM